MKGTLSDIYKNYIEVIKSFREKDPSRKYRNIVGDFGEQFACEYYNLTKNNGKGFDAKNAEGKKVEIKARTDLKGKVEIKKDAEAEILIVLHIDDEGNITEIFNGLMKTFFENAKYHERSNDYQLSIKKLKEL